jgi:ATP-GRASP peptide maturase of grasp-with-spasm system
MILILSIESDLSTTEVQFWLKHYNVETIRISDKDMLSLDRLEISDEQKIKTVLRVWDTQKTFRLYLHKVKNYWYRRGEFNIGFQRFYANETMDILTVSTMNKMLKREHDQLSAYFDSNLTTDRSLNSFKDNELNKLHVLAVAKQFGLAVPPTIVTNKKKILAHFFNLHGEIITKAIWNGQDFQLSALYFYSPTLLFDFNALKKNIPGSFPVTLFQKNIPKKYELRIFYLNETMYASCIFSQRDAQTTIDFREYNQEKPNRVVPYEIPKVVAGKIVALMRYLKLKSGSIDMIYGKDDCYYFLEVNPIGQFKQVSMPCNYYLEREIAKTFL